jgi:hypothetical protein
MQNEHLDAELCDRLGKNQPHLSGIYPETVGAILIRGYRGRANSV